MVGTDTPPASPQLFFIPQNQAMLFKSLFFDIFHQLVIVEAL
jgi:hypothetical protein